MLSVIGTMKKFGDPIQTAIRVTLKKYFLLTLVAKVSIHQEIPCDVL